MTSPLRFLAIAATCCLSFAACSGGEDVAQSDTQNVTAKTGGEIEMYRSHADGQYRFRVKAANGETILVSEAYKGRGGAMRGIESVLANGRSLEAFEFSPAASNPDGKSSGDYYFVLKARNGHTIAQSEVYSTKSNARAGAKTVIGYILGEPALDNWADKCGMEMFEGADEDIYVQLRAKNGEIMMVTEGYEQVGGALNAIESSIKNGEAGNFEILEAANGEFYFNLKAGNGAVLATSETYTEKSSAEQGAETAGELLAAQTACIAEDAGRELVCSYSIEPPVADDTETLEDEFATPYVEVDATNLATFDTLVQEQIRTAVNYQTEDYDLDFITGPDDDRVYLMTINQDGTEYDWVQFYLGDTEVGVIFANDTLDIVALVGDGDVYGCSY